MSNVFIAVEGPQDVEFLARLFEAQGLRKEVILERLTNEFCTRIINTRFPHEGDLHKRMPNPMFLTDGTRWIALQPAGGDTQLRRLVRQALLNLQDVPRELVALGVVRDADRRSPTEHLDAVAAHVKSLHDIPSFRIEVPPALGMVVGDAPRFGCYVLPDNQSSGTLDTILLECGQIAYADLISGAQTYVNGIDLSKLDREDARLIKKPSGKTKAVVACTGSILKPGMSIATSIDQNHWLNETSLKLPRVAALAAFLRELCRLN